MNISPYVCYSSVLSARKNNCNRRKKSEQVGFAHSEVKELFSRGVTWGRVGDVSE